MLSIGSGSGAKERNFSKFSCFDEINGIELSDIAIKDSQAKLIENKINNVKYFLGDFKTFDFADKKFDVILFNSSLHHFDNIDDLLKNKVKNLLKNTDSFLIIFEYVGPNRLQWSDAQLMKTNELLKTIPKEYRIKYKSSKIKKRVYRPGLLRMLLTDPSEAIDSESILPSLHNHFEIIEEKTLGGNITQLLFKDISHHFYNNSTQTTQILDFIFNEEDKFVNETDKSDGIFGIYKPKIT